ncbi:hypothetical protein I79_011779 [Cricetulus griseus]|uniref:Uncharacterized protein n=1 Tax=Cricetulus griseus TaxID=10029 RepID=G3HM33_CRIGR|nr:hypothetical protein I79_011779 [Cricetulus griseus]
MAEFWGGTEFHLADDQECSHVFVSPVSACSLRTNKTSKDSLMGYHTGDHI